MATLGINLGYFIFQVLNFSIVLILLYAWAYKPILSMLKKRKETIAHSLEDARIAAEARANARTGSQGNHRQSASGGQPACARSL